MTVPALQSHLGVTEFLFESTYLGRNMRRFQFVPQFDGFSKVTIVVSDEIEYSAGSDLGRTLRLICPWGTTEMAENILANVQGYQYQPYTAEGALIDPAAELGDGITANNVYGGIYANHMKFGSRLTATVSAPEDEEINHEYPYKSKPNKEITREAKMLRATLAVEAARISAEVENRKSDVEILTAMLQVQAGLIEAKVSKTGGLASSFGWVLDDSSWTIQANSTDVLKANRDGLEVYGKITATSGKIGGFDIKSNYLSYNNQTWGGTNTYGAYLGTSGIQLGKNFKVDMSGNLYAASGTFAGNVYAGNIQYGGSYGTFSGSGISSSSISGNRLVGGTITTAYTSSGINAALNDGTWAANILSGVQDYNVSIRVGTVSCLNLFQDGNGFSMKSATFKDYDGNNVTIKYWGW